MKHAMNINTQEYIVIWVNIEIYNILKQSQYGFLLYYE